VSALLLAALIAGAPRLAIVASVIDDPDETIVGELRREAELGLRYVADVEVISIQEIEAQLAPAIARCKQDPTCTERAYRDSNVDLALEIVLNPGLSLCSAELIEVSSKKSLAKAAETVRRSAPRGPLVGVLLDHLMRSNNRQMGGGLLLSVKPEDAEVTITPGPLRPSEDHRRFILTGGTHQLKVSHPDYQPLVRPIDIAPLRDLTVEVQLEEPSIASSPWLWIGVGAGTAAIATTLIVLLARSQVYYLCQASDPSDCH